MNKELYKELQEKALIVISKNIWFKDNLVVMLQSVDYLDIPEYVIYYGTDCTTYIIDRIKYDLDQGILIHCCKKQKDKNEVQECNEWISPNTIEYYDLKYLFIKDF